VEVGGHLAPRPQAGAVVGSAGAAGAREPVLRSQAPVMEEALDGGSGPVDGMTGPTGYQP